MPSVRLVRRTPTASCTCRALTGLRAVRVTATSLTTLWHADPAGTPIVGGGVVLAPAQSDGVLYALDPASGAVKAKVSMGDPTTRFAAPAMSADGFVYVGTSTGTGHRRHLVSPSCGHLPHARPARARLD